MSVQKQLKKMRKLTWELYAQNQIPSRLCFAICETNNIQNKEDVLFFTKVTKDLLRVRGYYKDQDMNKRMNEEFTRVFDLYKQKRKEENKP